MQRIRIFLFLNLLHHLLHRSLRSLIEGVVNRDIRRYIGSKLHRQRRVQRVVSLKIQAPCPYRTPRQPSQLYHRALS